MTSPDALEREFTLTTAVVRYDRLRTRDALAPAATLHPDEPDGVEGEALSREEALELIALGELIARKAGYGRQLAVRTARANGASWSQIGTALGTSKQAAWEAHTRWIEEQIGQHDRNGHEGFDAQDAAAARALAGPAE
jgi:hypothetical protein